MSGSTTDTTEASDPVPVPVDPVELPGTRRSQRARRRRRRQRARRLRVALAVGLAAVLVGVVVLVAGGGGGGGGGDGTGDGGSAAAVAPFLLAQRGGSGEAVSLTLLVPAAGGKGGSLVLLPPGTLTEAGALGVEPIGRSLKLQGPDRLKADIENLLGVALGGIAVVDDQALGSMLAPVGPLRVDVADRVEEVDPSGRVKVLFEAGEAVVPPDQAGRYLSVKGQGTDLSRLARHQPFFEAWLAAVRARPDAAPTDPPGLARAFDALSAGSVRTRLLPVEAFGSTSTEELYRVRTEELTRMVAQIFPGAEAAGTRPRVQILNGTGAVGLAAAVRDRLGPRFDVRTSGNAAHFDYATTQVVYYDRSEQALAQRAIDALGVGSLVFSRRPLDVVDVTIIVGKDFKPA